MWIVDHFLVPSVVDRPFLVAMLYKNGLPGPFRGKVFSSRMQSWSSDDPSHRRDYALPHDIVDFCHLYYKGVDLESTMCTQNKQQTAVEAMQ
jgi:hypothetical protein